MCPGNRLSREIHVNDAWTRLAMFRRERRWRRRRPAKVTHETLLLSSQCQAPDKNGQNRFFSNHKGYNRGVFPLDGQRIAHYEIQSRFGSGGINIR